MSDKQRGSLLLPKRGVEVTDAQYRFGMATIILFFSLAACFVASAVSSWRSPVSEFDRGNTSILLLLSIFMLGCARAGYKVISGSVLAAGLSLLGWMIILPQMVFALLGLMTPHDSIAHYFAPDAWRPWTGSAPVINEPSLMLRLSLLVLLLAAFAVVSSLVLRPTKGERNAATSIFSKGGALSLKKLLVVFLMALILGIVWGQQGPLTAITSQYTTSQVPNFDESGVSVGFLGTILNFIIAFAVNLPLAILSWFSSALATPEFVIPAGLMMLWMGGRIAVEHRGVRFYFLRPWGTLLFIPWRRVARCDLIVHDQRRDVAVLRWRMWGFIPISIGVHAKHWIDGENIVATVATTAGKNGVPVVNWSSSRIIVRIACVLLVAALIPCGLQMYAWTKAWEPFMRDSFDMQNFAQIAQVAPMTTLALLPVLMIGLAFGLLSAYHRAGPRPVLAGVWMLAAQLLPTPLLHWLVWMAVYAIYSAMLGHHPNVAPPSPQSFQIALSLLAAMPVLAGLSYLVGVVVGCKKMKEMPEAIWLRSPAEAPMPTSEQVLPVTEG